MFRWYRAAKVCIAYLYDVTRSENDSSAKSDSPNLDVFKQFEKNEPSVWFSRGWTLQELLAPREMQFYDKEWNEFGTKSTLAHQLQEASGIDAEYLRGEKHFSNACIATRMSWMANRTTEREEDMAYSMLGIFDINMTPQYGEGMRAFMRLQKILLSNLLDESLFAWRMPEEGAGVTAERLEALSMRSPGAASQVV